MKKLPISCLMLFLILTIINPLSIFAESNAINEIKTMKCDYSNSGGEDNCNSIENTTIINDSTVKELINSINVDGNNEATIAINGQEDTIDITIEKVWVGQKLNEITIHLLADNKIVQTVKLSDKNGWAYTFTNLSRLRQDGSEIDYTIEEVMEDGYETSIDGTWNEGFKIKNKEVAPPTKAEETTMKDKEISDISKETSSNETAKEVKESKKKSNLESSKEVSNGTAPVNNKPSDKDLSSSSNKTNQIPQLGWENDVVLSMLGVGFIASALFLFAKQKNKVD